MQYRAIKNKIKLCDNNSKKVERGDMEVCYFQVFTLYHLKIGCVKKYMINLKVTMKLTKELQLIN